MDLDFIDYFKIALKIFKIALKKFFTMLVGILTIGLIINFLINFLPNFINGTITDITGKKTVIEGKFTIVNKKENDGKTFTLESHTKTKERYTVSVSDIIYQSYFVNENIKAAFASYEKVKTCNELEIKSTFEKETIRKED